MKLSFLTEHTMNWITADGDPQGMVISSRIRLARNLENAMFPGKAETQQLKKISSDILPAVKKVSEFKSGYIYDMLQLEEVDRILLMERHLISHEHALNNWPRSMAMSGNESFSLMLNEEDHIRMQGIVAGLSLRTVWNAVDALAAQLSGMLSFAYDAQWGYLTACPTNVGTGMRASCLLHLPALVMSGEINTVLSGFTRIGITTRGLYGENTRMVGDMFQVSNASSLGKSEEEIIDSLERVVNQIRSRESDRRDDLMKGEMRPRIEDKIFRSYGILTHTRSIDFEESMQLLSLMRMGKTMGMNLPVTLPVLNRLMIDIQPAHIQELAGKKLNAHECDMFRADFVRKTLEKNRKRNR